MNQDASEPLRAGIRKDFEQSFAAAVDDAVVQLNPAGNPDLESGLVQKAAIGGLLQALLDIFKTLGAAALVHIPEIKAAALNVYDTKIAPIQILPAKYAAFEVIIDAGGRVAVERIIDAIALALQTPAPK